MKLGWGRLAAVLLGVGLGGLSCDVVDLPDDPLLGPPCYVDSDCVPNACCGEGTGVVSASQAPDCRTVRCSGSCNPNSIQCGCGLPVCRDGHCAVAYTSGPACP